MDAAVVVFVVVFVFFAVGLLWAQRRPTGRSVVILRRKLVFVGWGLLGLGLAIYGVVSGATGISTVGSVLAAANALLWWYVSQRTS